MSMLFGEVNEMERTSISDGEWKLMNLLWDRQPRTVGELMNELKKDTGWSDETIRLFFDGLDEEGGKAGK